MQKCRACTGSGSFLVDLQCLEREVGDEVKELAARIQEIAARETRALKLVVQSCMQ